MTPLPELDIAQNRKARKWSRAELIRRVLWAALSPAFRFSPRPLWWWRSALLRGFGASIGAHVQVDPRARIAMPWNLTIGDWSAVGWDAVIYSLGLVTIGRCVTISQRAHLCAGAHDYRQPHMPLLKKPIDIGDNAWVCADAFIGPGTRVGVGAVVGARAVVVADVAPWTVVVGNPAKAVKNRQMRAPGVKD